MTKIFFYFPYYEECGVPILFLRISRWLAKNHPNEYDVYVCDFADGAMARNIKKNDNVKVALAGSTKGITIMDNDILIMQSLVPYYWPKELHIAPKAKIFYWTLHFRNLTPSLLPFPWLRELPFRYRSIFRFCSLFHKKRILGIAEMIQDMMRHNAHYFMDISTQKQCELHIPIRKPQNMDYLPVPASDYLGPYKKHDPNKLIIDACWLGRISYEKTPILIHTLEACSKHACKHKQKIRFHILGFGEYVDKINKLEVDNEYFTKFTIHSIRFNEINKYLLDNVDVMFAMGTSALEAAKLKIPTVLVDCTPSMHPIKGDYLFKFIDERCCYDLGHCITSKDMQNGNNSIDEVFMQLKTNYDKVAINCYNHFNAKHSLSSVGAKLYDILQKMNYTFDMINPKTIERPWLLDKYNTLRGLDR